MKCTLKTKSLSWLCVLFLAGFKLSFANPILVTMNEVGSLVSMASDNPFGVDTSSYWGPLNCSSSLSFLLPTNPDLAPFDPVHGNWVTTGSGWITANNVTLHFDGPVSLSMTGESDNDRGSFSAHIANTDFSLNMFVTCNQWGVTPESIPDDNLQNIFNLPVYGYMRTNFAFTDSESIYTTYAPVAVPDNSSYAAFIGATVLAFVIIRRRLSV